MRGIAQIDWLALLLVLILPGRSFSQAEQQNGTLIVPGHARQAPVTQLDGRPYVAIDALARLMNDSLGYRGNEINFDAAGGRGACGQPDRKPSILQGVFKRSDRDHERHQGMAECTPGWGRQRRSEKSTHGWIPTRRKPQKNLRLASVAATTASDRDTLQLLNKELGHMQQLNNKVLAARKNRSYITSDSLKKDPLDQKIPKCARSLGEMAAQRRVSGRWLVPLRGRSSLELFLVYRLTRER